MVDGWKCDDCGKFWTRDDPKFEFEYPIDHKGWGNTDDSVDLCFACAMECKNILSSNREGLNFF